VINFQTYCLTSEERVTGAHWLGGWVDMRTDTGDVTKRNIYSPLPEIKPRFLGVTRSTNTALSKESFWPMRDGANVKLK
jgi:hypothetical protein